MHDIIEDAASEFDDANYLDDGLDEDIDPDQNVDETTENDPNRTKTSKSKDSQRKSVRVVRSRPRKYGYSANNISRDQTIDLIIQSRNTGIIENDYTLLSQTTSQHRRSSPHVRIHSVKQRTSTIVTETDLHANETKDRRTNSILDKLPVAPPPIQFDNDKWDDGLNTEFDKGRFFLNFTIR